jgi:urea carboxylase
MSGTQHEAVYPKSVAPFVGEFYADLDYGPDGFAENGSEPSNIIDHGYPLGAINLAGQTPIILVSDGPSMGGFINPYTVPSAAFWKLGQSRPGDIYRFKAITVDEAQALRRQQDALCSETSIV